MFSINNLKSMEVVDVESGCKLGYMKDMVVDCTDNKVISILVPGQKIIWFSKNKEIEIPWNRIVKIGVDVILVNAADLFDIND